MAELLLIDLPDPALVQRLRLAPVWFTPQHAALELLNVARKMDLRDASYGVRLADALTFLTTRSPLIRIPLEDELILITGKLLGGLTPYDAAYVALAHGLDLPLVTNDRRLSRAPGLPVDIEVFDQG